MNHSSLISINGQIFPSEQAVIPATDRGFLFGERVVEVLVSFHGVILNLDKHLDRLENSCKKSAIALPCSREQLAKEMQELTSAVKLPKALLRIVLTRGNAESLHLLDATSSSRFIYCFPAHPVDQRCWEQGMKFFLQELPYTERGSTAKTGHYMRSIHNIEKARKEGFDDILHVNSEGEVTEASTANVFFIGRDGDQVEIATPSPKSGLLLGITRDTIISLLERSGIPVTERIIYADEIARFDEAFVSSTVRGLIPILSINNHRLHSSREKAVFHHIRRLHHTWAETQIGFRVDWNSGKRIEKQDSALLN